MVGDAFYTRARRGMPSYQELLECLTHPRRFRFSCDVVDSTALHRPTTAARITASLAPGA
jgi:hypothetical protein